MIKVIAVDFDDTIADFSRSFWAWHREKYGWGFTDEQLIDYNWQLAQKYNKLKFPVDFTQDYINEKLDEFANSPEHLQMPYLEGSIKILKYFKSMNIKLYVITARVKETRGNATIKWINTYMPNIFSDVLFTANYKNGKIVFSSKIEYVRKINADLIIDDAIKNILHMAENNIPAILMEQLWNIDLSLKIVKNKSFYRHFNIFNKHETKSSIDNNVKSFESNDILNPVDIDSINLETLPIISVKNWVNIKDIFDSIAKMS